MQRPQKEFEILLNELKEYNPEMLQKRFFNCH